MRAIISGAFGQDAKWLADLLIDKGVEVTLVYRYSSVPIQERAKHYQLDKVKTVCLDIVDPTGINGLVGECQPDYIFNLAAQSHVGQSFVDPKAALEVNAVGVLNWLEAVRRLSPETKFLQASTSELWGSNYSVDEFGNKYQDEETPFSPNSPYAIAKLAAHNLCRVYRHSYGLFACTSICHNHECFYSNTPLIIKDKYGMLDVTYISNLISTHDERNNDIKFYSNGLMVWNGSDWTKIKAVSYQRLNNLEKPNRKIVFTRTKNGLVLTTPNHNFINIENNKVKQSDLVKKETILKTGDYPELTSNIQLTENFAMFLGLLCGDGYVSSEGSKIRFANNNKEYRDLFYNLAKKSGFGKGRKDIVNRFIKEMNGYSSYIDLLGVTVSQTQYLRDLLYDKKTKHKKVPQIILNSSNSCKKAFYDGYYISDGLKNYNYRSYKSNSPLLVQGLLLIKNGIFTIHPEKRLNRFYYKIDYPSYHTNNPSTFLHSDTVSNKNEYVFNIETECGYLNAGIGKLVVANSPVRGENFVTRKISKWIGSNLLNIRLNRNIEKLKLGNINAIRDWSHAKDIVRGMEMVIKHHKPDDFVLCSGYGNSIKDFLFLAFSFVGLNWQDYVEIDQSLYRPCEVEFLTGRYNKAKEMLGWEPMINFQELVEEMVRGDIG